MGIQDFVTVKQYIEQIKRAEKKRIKELDKPITNRPILKMSEIYATPAFTLMDKVVDRRVTEIAVLDLCKYLSECGVKAYNARKKDKEEKGQPQFLANIYFCADEQEIFVVSTKEYLEETFGKRHPVKAVPDKNTFFPVKEAEEYNPLAIMSDEQGFVDTYSLTE